MSDRTLNIIYNTDYTDKINGWGFVDHEFQSSQKWVLGSLFWNTNKKSKNNSNSNQNNLENQQTQTEQKAPGFFDLLFWPLNSPKENNTSNWKSLWWEGLQKNNQLDSVPQTNQIQSSNQNNDWNGSPKTSGDKQSWEQGAKNDISAITQNHEINNSQISEDEWNNENKTKKKSWIDSMLDNIFWTDDTSQKKNGSKVQQTSSESSQNKPEGVNIKETEQEKKARELREQIKKILEIPDDEYKDSMITSDMRRFIKKVDDEYTSNIADFKSHIAPSYWEYKSNWMNISGILWRTYYTQRYPTYIDAL